MEDSYCRTQPTRLPHPVRITEQVWPEGTVPVVSVRCVTYNHVNFIPDAIEGFLMQETTFPVEILIHDDASTDGTADIVREYQSKYPQLIRTVLQKENQFSQGVKPGRFIDPIMRGEFIAFCEGDDFWTTVDKLEAQVEKLVKEPKAVLCGGKTRIVRLADGELVEIGTVQPARIKSSYDLEDILKNYSFHTSSYVCRLREIASKFQSDTFSSANGDEVILALCAAVGPVLYVDKYLSAYRLHTGGIWAGETTVRRWKKGFDTLLAIDTYFDLRYRSAILQRQKRNIIDATRELSSNGDSKGVAQVLQHCRNEISTFGPWFPRILEMLSVLFVLQSKWNLLRQKAAIRTRLRKLTAGMR